MFGHTVGGHDTTSSLTSVGNGLPIQKLKESSVPKPCENVYQEVKLARKKEKEKNKRKKKS